MTVKRRKRITVRCHDAAELEQRLAILIDSMTSHGAEILRVTRPMWPQFECAEASILYETVAAPRTPSE